MCLRICQMIDNAYCKISYKIRLEIREDRKPGCVIPSVISGRSPSVHTHLGSPSSSPFVIPSPSESSLQMQESHF